MTGKKRVLSGIKPTGNPHIGNYAGMLLPMLNLAADTQYNVNIFIADYHSLNDTNARKNLGALSLEMAATLLALGFDPKGCTFYRQSDVPETFELTSFLSNFTPKGLMNRAHAYKAAINDKLLQLMTKDSPFFEEQSRILREFEGNTELAFEKLQVNLLAAYSDADIGINMGLYLYPLLMTADILLFDADFVPVGRDQRQHIEIARDIAGAVNAVYGQSVLKAPEGLVQPDTNEVPGIDGRKMSKSYGNVLPIFAPPAEVEKIIKRIKTDSKQPAEPKDADNLLLKFHQAMSSESVHQKFKDRFLPGGMGYGEAKQELMAAHEKMFGRSRAEFDKLMQDSGYVRSVLKDGAAKARDLAAPILARVRKAAAIDA
jgi:tryptophanyl-tRNA synthetase